MPSFPRRRSRSNYTVNRRLSYSKSIPFLPILALGLGLIQDGFPSTPDGKNTRNGVDVAIREGLLGETFYGLYPEPMRRVADSNPHGLMQVLHMAGFRHTERLTAFLAGRDDPRERATLLRVATLLPAYRWTNAEFHRQYGDAVNGILIDVPRLADLTRRISADAPVRTRLFHDVPVDHWAARAVGDLRALGLLDGYPDERFRG